MTYEVTRTRVKGKLHKVTNAETKTNTNTETKTVTNPVTNTRNNKETNNKTNHKNHQFVKQCTQCTHAGSMGFN